MRVSPPLACLRRRLLRRYLADARLCPGEVALAIGVTPEYFAKMLAGSRPVTDGVAWRLFRCFSIPFWLLEPLPSFLPLALAEIRQLERDIDRWQHNCPDLS
jgi:hypothetical protein